MEVGKVLLFMLEDKFWFKFKKEKDHYENLN